MGWLFSCMVQVGLTLSPHVVPLSFPQVERHNKPEVEYGLHPELMLPPVSEA